MQILTNMDEETCSWMLWRSLILVKACIPGVVREQIWIQHVEKPMVQIFAAIVPPGDRKKFAYFAWWHVQGIFRPGTIKLYIKIEFYFLSISHYFKRNPQQYPLWHNWLISYNSLLYGPLSWYRRLMLKLLPVVYVVMGAASLNHMHMSSRNKMQICCQAPHIAQIAPKICIWVFQYAGSRFAITFALWPVQEYKL